MPLNPAQLQTDIKAAFVAAGAKEDSPFTEAFASNLASAILKQFGLADVTSAGVAPPGGGPVPSTGKIT